MLKLVRVAESIVVAQQSRSACTTPRRHTSFREQRETCRLLTITPPPGRRSYTIFYCYYVQLHATSRASQPASKPVGRPRPIGCTHSGYAARAVKTLPHKPGREAGALVFFLLSFSPSSLAARLVRTCPSIKINFGLVCLQPDNPARGLCAVCWRWDCRCCFVCWPTTCESARCGLVGDKSLFSR